ncbi:MAG TPA: phosphoenolpyruvate carboxykinase (ATP) [Chitinophagaceae bacterium]|jgi:phosphoenolpyruvate carboxykinase (ATP)|nr:phosphoenolpyruvate carboxykinase (ATP) [Chitinophagaceae bacterium]
MSIPERIFPARSVAQAGLRLGDAVHYQCTPEEDIQHTLRRGEGTLSDSGALVIRTGEFTGRSPKDKFTVEDELTRDTVDWNEFNIPLSEEKFTVIHRQVLRYFEGLPEVWVRDCQAGADPRYRINIRLMAEKPWTDLFAYNLFLRPEASELERFQPDWQVFSAPGLKLNPAECGVRQPNATVVSFRHRIILIAGSGYTGETKKGIFSILNFLLPRQGVLPMHCSANKGPGGDTAIFFGLSGTGKTTLSADPERQLIGDDEHGWTDDGIFNFEGGCYAKAINLSAGQEPEIYGALRPGALVENVTFHPGTNTINFNDASVTENTRLSYPIHFMAHAAQPSLGGLPRHIFFLTCDAYGVLPPIARLTAGQAMYQFISGYTAKVAGTEAGVTEPKPTFSACFGAPFLPLHPVTYAELLGRKMQAHKTTVWLVNTGWTGGAYGTGHRIRLAHTRALIRAALEGMLEAVPFTQEGIFGLAVPGECPGVPSGILQPRRTWADGHAYDEKARYLAGLFIDNFRKYLHRVPEEIQRAAPRL